MLALTVERRYVKTNSMILLTLGLYRKAANLTDKFEVMEEKVFALVERAYDVMERSWLDLGEVGRQLSKENTKSQEKAVMDKMEALRSM